MAIAEDLKTLEELHQRGKLTDAEYSAAKTSTLEGERPQDAGLKRRFSWRVPIVLLVVLMGLLAFVWYIAGAKITGQMIATVVHAPMELRNEVENLRANSWKALPFTTTYAGSVTINVRVVRGNPMGVLVVDANQLDTLKAGEWGKALSYTEFNALKTQVYERSARLQQGSYYLVLRDTSLGILSSSASDVSVKIDLHP